MMSAIARTALRVDLAKSAPSADEIRVGDEDYLSAAAREGLSHTGFVQILRGIGLW